MFRNLKLKIKITTLDGEDSEVNLAEEKKRLPVTGRGSSPPGAGYTAPTRPAPRERDGSTALPPEAEGASFPVTLGVATDRPGDIRGRDMSGDWKRAAWSGPCSFVSEVTVRRAVPSWLAGSRMMGDPGPNAAPA